jgi:hypothetical protein
MRLVARFSLLAVLVLAAACSSSSSSKNDGGGVDGAGCPAQMPTPGSSSACTGSTVCEYGQSTCCGVMDSFMTCTCRDGMFDCVQTVECNFVCPDAGGGG